MSLAKAKEFVKSHNVCTSPVTILAILLVLTFIAAGTAYISHSKNRSNHIESKINLVKTAIETTVTSHIDSMIRPITGLFIASQNVDAIEFADFAKNLQTSYMKNGIQAVNYVTRLPREDLPLHIKRMREAGFKDYDVWPLPQKINADVFSVTHLYPINWRNKTAHGYNVGAEKRRRQAMDLARDTGEPAMTPQLTLVQENGFESQTGFMIFMPHFRKNAPIETKEQRAQALKGFVSGVFRSKIFFDLLMQTLLQEVGPLKVELYDGAAATEKFYSFSAVPPHNDLENPENSRDVPIKIAHHRWHARIATIDARPAGIINQLHWFILLLGLLTSSLVFLVTKLIQLQNRELSKDVHLLTETKRHLQEAKEAAETANNMKDSFLANMSHEIRTPLSVIISSSKFLMDPETAPEEKENFIQIVHRNGKNLLSIVNEILDFSKIEAGQINLEFIKIPLRPILNDIAADMKLLAQAKNILYELEIDPEVPEFFGTDPMRFQQILRNIIGNAIKFTQQGKVYVRVEPAPGNKLRILVQDSGVGISADQQHFIFQPFSQGDITFTRKFGGTGLGLVLSKRFARLLGGDCTLKSSEAAEGSVFEITIKNELSAQPARFAKSAERPDDKKNALIGKKILLVEDNSDSQFVISRILQRHGADVVVAQNGQEGVEKALREKFNLVLMDIQMPVMDGFTATKILREKGYAGLIFVLTAHIEPHLKESSIKVGFNDYLSKPFPIDELLDKFKKMYAEPIPREPEREFSK